MNAHDDDLPNAAAPPNADAADAPAKPKRARRPRMKDAPVDATAADAPDAATPAPAEARAPAETPAAVEETSAAVEETSARVEADAPVEPAAAVEASVAGPVPAAGTSAPSDGEPDGDAPRGRNRRRRNRSRGERDDAGPTQPPVAVATDEGDDDETADETPALPPTDVNEVFSAVLSGAFDAEPPVEPDAAQDTEQSKRVLAAQPDAPKLHKVLAQAGVGSRRDMEQLIAEGRILVNGEPAHTGQRIAQGDRIIVDGRPVRLRIAPPEPRVVAYHKPAGEIVTHDDPQNRPTVFRRLPRLPQGKWQSVGRLDINTEGLLLFTNSGDLANRLMHPRFGVEREYAVRVLGQLDEDSREDLLEGVDIEPGVQASFKSVEDGGGDGANRWYRVVITEGRNREVRRLFDAVGLTVNRLIRVRYGNVVLPKGLKRGVWVALGDADVRAIRRLAGGDQPEQRGGNANDPRGNKRGKRGRNNERGNDRNAQPPQQQPPQQRWPREANQQAPVEARDDDEEDDHHGPIPNPLQQTYDRRFVQNQRGPFGGGGGGGGGGGRNRGRGGGQGGGGQGGQGGGQGGSPKQPDPMQTSVGYIGADAFFRKLQGGGRRGGGGGGGGGGGRGRR
jgi:23S rRNA pseudouridine2605 synthase